MLRLSEGDLAYVRDLMEKNYEAVGFIPAPRLEHYAERDRLWLQYENGEPCGYLVFGNGWPALKVYQCAIQYDARRQEHASALVRRLMRRAQASGSSCIALWCADDLEANRFWQAMGFHLAGRRRGGMKRGRIHNRWVYWLPNARQHDLFMIGASP